MSVTPFKTPMSYPRSIKSETSDSDESTANSEASSGVSELSVVTLFDDLVRLINIKKDENNNLLQAFMNFSAETKLMWVQYKSAMAECNRLQIALDNQTHNFNEINRNLYMARTMLDDEKQKRKQAEREVFELRQQVGLFCRNIMADNRNNITEAVRDQIVQLNNGRKSWEQAQDNHLDTIREVNSTGSILSEFSYSRSEDDLDSSKCYGPGKGWKKYKSNADGAEEPAVKKRRSRDKVVEIGQSETVRATTTLTVNKEGPITATSIIESVPTERIHGYSPQVVPSSLIFESWAQNGSPATEKSNVRQHQFQNKTIVMPDDCSACSKRIRFGKSALRCKDCKSFCHPECKNLLPLPCVPLANTPCHKKMTGTIGDFTPTCSPMVPAIIVHCANEIEQRGLKELGLYRIPGSERDVKGLKERFLAGRGSPNLKDVDIHVLCGCLKDFLRSLTEPLVSNALWKDFTEAVKAKDKQDVLQGLYQTISELPQPNRDTLAYIILHLQRIANAPDCKMPTDNLSKIFGPTIVGYSREDTNANIMEETRLAVVVMDHLLRMPSDYWASFVNVSQTRSTGTLQQTPSTDSLLRPTTSRIFTPASSSKLGVGRLKRKKEGRLFHTPPNFR